MNGEVWINYEDQSAPRDLLCLFRRNAETYYRAVASPYFSLAAWRREIPSIGYARDFPLDLDTTGLEWKLTGIAHEELNAGRC